MWRLLYRLMKLNAIISRTRLHDNEPLRYVQSFLKLLLTLYTARSSPAQQQLRSDQAAIDITK